MVSLSLMNVICFLSECEEAVTADLFSSFTLFFTAFHLCLIAEETAAGKKSFPL